MFPRPTLLRLWETSAGNPFFALELGRALQRRGGTLALGEALPIPAALGELLQNRLDELAPSELEVAAFVALLATPTVTLVEAAVGQEAGACLNEALAAKIVELDDERVLHTPAARNGSHRTADACAETLPPRAPRRDHAEQGRGCASSRAGYRRARRERGSVPRGSVSGRPCPGGSKRSRRARGRSATTDACSVSPVGVATAERGKAPPRGR